MREQKGVVLTVLRRDQTSNFFLHNCATPPFKMKHPARLRISRVEYPESIGSGAVYYPEEHSNLLLRCEAERGCFAKTTSSFVPLCPFASSQRKQDLIPFRGILNSDITPFIIQRQSDAVWIEAGCRSIKIILSVVKLLAGPGNV